MLDFLHQNALWLIMDAWFPHPWPKDRQRWPDIDQHNQITIDAIVAYLPNLQHVAISVAGAYRPHEALAHLPNTLNNFTVLQDLMTQRGLTHIVYTGFHWGLCLLRKPDGAVNVGKRTEYQLWAYQPLCSVMPGTDKNRMDAKMALHVELL
jgi:hypothetical protein